MRVVSHIIGEGPLRVEKFSPASLTSEDINRHDNNNKSPVRSPLNHWRGLLAERVWLAIWNKSDLSRFNSFADSWRYALVLDVSDTATELNRKDIMLPSRFSEGNTFYSFSCLFYLFANAKSFFCIHFISPLREIQAVKNTAPEHGEQLGLCDG